MNFYREFRVTPKLAATVNLGLVAKVMSLLVSKQRLFVAHARWLKRLEHWPWAHDLAWLIFDWRFRRLDQKERARMTPAERQALRGYQIR